MNDDEVLFRLRRIQRAVDAGTVREVSEVPATRVAGKGFHGIGQKFGGGLREEDIHNIAHNIIGNIANLRAHLTRWAKANGKDPQKVSATFNSSRSIRIIQDLFNLEKHPYPPRDGGHTGDAPELGDVDTALRLQGGTPGRWTGVCMDPRTGGIRKFGDGSAAVVVTGQVVDKHGKVVGDLLNIALQAVKDWEQLLAEYGVAVTGCGSLGSINGE